MLNPMTTRSEALFIPFSSTISHAVSTNSLSCTSCDCNLFETSARISVNSLMFQVDPSTPCANAWTGDERSPKSSSTTSRVVDGMDEMGNRSDDTVNRLLSTCKSERVWVQRNSEENRPCIADRGPVGVRASMPNKNS